MERRDRLGRVAVLQDVEWHVFMQQQLEPVEQLAGRGLFLEPGNVADFVKNIHCLGDEDLLDAGEMDVDDRLHRVAIGEFDIMEKATAQKRVGQFFFIVRSDDDDRAFLGGDRFVRFIHVKRHAIEFLQQIVGEFDVRLVDFVDQQHRKLRRGERLPELAFADIVGNVMDTLIAELAVAQPRDRIIFVEPLLRLGRGFDVPGDQRRAKRLRDLFGKHGLAGAGLALDEQWAAQRDGGIDRYLEIIGRNIGFCAGKAHRRISFDVNGNSSKAIRSHFVVRKRKSIGAGVSAVA